MEQLLGGEYDAFLSAMAERPLSGLRVNTLKADPAYVSRVFGDLRRVPWTENGFYLPEENRCTKHPFYYAGLYYIQEPSAMSSAALLGTRPGERILDLCAAPGGKTTDLAASLRAMCGDGFTLLANEVMKARFRVLRENVATWGDSRVAVLSRDPSAFPDRPVFDAIVADVPCSGEGMFRKDDRAVEEWSAQTVAFCAARQRRILSDIWPSLKEGGLLVYSTCTFNREENDGNVGWICEELGAEVLDPGDICGVTRTQRGYALLPGLVPGEGQYAAALRKTAPAGRSGKGDPVLELGATFPAAAAPAGPEIDVDLPTALQYLHGDAVRLPADAPKGLLTVCYRGHALGPAKNLGTRANNLYPKEKRIRKDIR